MANIPGVVLPGAYSDVVTASTGVSIPGGTRIAAIIGEGIRSEVIVSSALGSGKDGFNSSYTSTTSGTDGRHFKLTLYPLIENRTKIYRNGVPLNILESTIDSNPFSTLYDGRLDSSTGKLELQQSRLIDQNGAFYTASSLNVGTGVINSLQLVDSNAPSENWTIRCVSVQRNNLNAPIINTGKFVAFGSVSGSKLDANGNPVIWTANNQVVSNGILSFSILDSVAFKEGDSFTIKVYSGVLSKNDSLTAEYIYVADLNDPSFLESADEVSKKHGFVSASNTLALGAQLAFANGTPGVMAVQAAPPMPRRSSYVLVDEFHATSTNVDNFLFPLPVGVVPDVNSNIHFFVTNPSTGTESQVLPNKFPFYTLDTSGQPTTSAFVFDNVAPPGGNSFSYSVNSSQATMFTVFDGYIARDPAYMNRGYLSSSTAFNTSHVGKTVKIIDATNVANNTTYTVQSVTNGTAYVVGTGFAEFVSEASVAFEVTDQAGTTVLDSATDGTVTPIISTDTADFATNQITGVDFSAITNILTRRIKINGTGSNAGLYDITAYNSLLNTVTIQKAVVSESGLRFEVLDSLTQSYYVVVNKNVVPNGYSLRVNLVDEKDATFYDSGWLAALESLERVECDIVVPLPRQMISIIFQNTLAHCKTMSNIKNRKERVLFCGAINGLTPDNLTGDEDAAVENVGVLEGVQGDEITEVLAGNVEDLTNYSVSDAFGSTFRCAYFGPDQIFVQASSETIVVDGFYIAAAAAGYLSANVRVEVPLTNKVLAGFTIPRTRMYSQSVQERLVQSGVCLLQPVAGGGRVVWGLTTSQSGFPEEQELSIIFIRDRIAKVMRGVFEGFIGTAEDPNLIPLLYARGVGALNSFISQNLISAYSDLVIKRDTVDPRQWNVSVRVQPIYPVNWIYIKVSVGLI